MAEVHVDSPTVIGSDAVIKGEMTFDKAVRIEGTFEGQIRSKGMLTIAEGSRVIATVEAGNVRLEGECKGNLTATEKLQLMSTAKMEGDIRATRLEIADGAIFIGNVTVGSSGPVETRRAPLEAHVGPPRSDASRVPGPPQPIRPRPQPQPQSHEVQPAATA